MYREIFKTYYTTLFIFRLKTSDVSAKNEKSSRREISMGKIVFESVDTFITRNVSSFRNRDYYREMEKEITKDVESLRERRTERARRRKLHFHRGHLPPLTPNMHIALVHEIVSPQRYTLRIYVSRTYREFFSLPNP